MIFAANLYSKRKRRRAAGLESVRSMEGFILSEHVLERAGCPIHYWLGEPQERPLVVFTHGATADHHIFDLQLQQVAQEYRVLVWNVRGHGKSRMPATAPTRITRSSSTRCCSNSCASKVE